MFKKLLSALTGKKTETTAAKTSPTPDAPPSDEPLITVYDAYGRELKITRSEWHEKIFLPNLEQKWNAPDALYTQIINGLNDGFAAELLPAAQRLLEIDTLFERSHTILGIVQMKNGQLDAAEATLRAGMAKVGETGTLLTNLAKVVAERGDETRSQDILWQAVQNDPNMENGLMWWAAIQRERDGEAGYLQALRTVAALPGSWRAQLWLARHHLEQKEVEQARALYAEVLAGGDFDGGALMMMSGDLGTNGQIGLILELIGPIYDEHQHDPMTGLNLLRACQMLHRLDEGEALLSRMYALGHAPLKQHLDAFAQTFQQMRAEQAGSTPIDPDTLKTTTLALSQPIWHYGLCNPDWLFAQKPKDAPAVGFFAFSKIMDGSEHAEAQREDDLGRFTRAIPLYLAEAAHYWTDYSATTFIIVVEGGGPVVSGGEMEGDALFDIVPANMAYFVTGEIGSSGEGEGDSAQWQIDLHLWDCAKRAKRSSESGKASSAELGALVVQLEKRLLDQLGLSRDEAFDGFYQHPSLDAMQPYLVALGQSFMLTLAANGISPKSAIWGERAMLDWPLNMALHWPTANVPKLMFISGLGKAMDYQSDVLAEYKERSLQLLREAERDKNPAARLAPLVWKAFGMNEALAAHRQALPADESPAYVAWLERVVDNAV